MSALTPFDTGERLQAVPWHVQPRNLPRQDERDRYGRVDFDDDEGTTILTAFVDRGSDGHHTLHIENVMDADTLQIAGDETAPLIEAPSKALQDRVDAVIAGLRSPVEREEAEVFWNAGRALILVPGEKGVRKQQLIQVAADGFTISAKVGSWGSGIRYTGID